MPPRGWQLRVEDILEALARIEQYSRDLSLETFIANPMVVDAVIRNLIVIGEATRNIPSDIQGRYPQVPWDEMKGIRNILSHEYFGVSTFILWETVVKDLPPLVPLLKEMLGGGTGPVEE